jgi:hypothetical protein
MLDDDWSMHETKESGPAFSIGMMVGTAASLTGVVLLGGALHIVALVYQSLGSRLAGRP